MEVTTGHTTIRNIQSDEPTADAKAMHVTGGNEGRRERRRSRSGGRNEAGIETETETETETLTRASVRDGHAAP